ncbi:MAG: uroporphyrinogen decarboxylase [Rhodospirillales bacterium]|nr:uroporphyrinogen decarboxylase [Rhodospirillales bacterium]
MIKKALLEAFRGPSPERPPFWFLRQAGRYLPEYRELRQNAPNFLDFCYSPELTVEAALQPLSRFKMDAAILFSDILVIPDALGCKVDFVEGQGPLLQPIRSERAIADLRPEGMEDHLQPVFASVRELRRVLPPETALIGFAGAPWTVALYMVEGRGGGESDVIRRWAYSEPESFAKLIEVLADTTVAYLKKQIECGAEVVMLFDTWAGLLSETQFHAWVIAPTAKIVSRLKASGSDVPIIGFPRGAGALYEDYVRETGIDGVSLDPTVPLTWAKEKLQPHCLVQGNLDNHLLVAGGRGLGEETGRILNALSGGGFIFNLGHGILPQTPPEHVARVAERLFSHDSAP